MVTRPIKPKTVCQLCVLKLNASVNICSKLQNSKLVTIELYHEAKEIQK